MPNETITIPLSEHAELLADKARLDFLEASHRALNAASGNASYGWKFITSENVRRLMAGPDLKYHFVDLSDANAINPITGGCNSVRVAIDRGAREITGNHDERNNSLIGKRLLEFGMKWSVDGDVIRCRECGRGMGYYNRHEALNHQADCKTYYGYPWALLENLLSVPTPFSPNPPQANPIPPCSKCGGYARFTANNHSHQFSIFIGCPDCGFRTDSYESDHLNLAKFAALESWTTANPPR